jgi:intergrase/recombinase
MLETFGGSQKNTILKSLIALSKYCGFYEQFQRKLKSYGIKWHRSNSIDAFFRMMSNFNSDILEWFNKSVKVLDYDLSMFLKFVLMTGIRKGEAVNSFNLILNLNKKGKIGEYYNEKLETLEHFRYPDLFFRNSKNVFISMIPEEMIMKIVNCNNITYEMIRKRLHRKGIRVRINELRDFYGTFMVRNGLIREEVDLLQGRIGKSVFVRHYFSPAIKDLKRRLFKALNRLEQEISS